MDSAPTLPQFLSFGSRKVSIIDGIGAQYERFGTLLLEDYDGTALAVIEFDSGGIDRTKFEILKRWLSGRGRKPVTWATLADVLDQCNLRTLSYEIRSEMGKSSHTEGKIKLKIYTCIHSAATT